MCVYYQIIKHTSKIHINHVLWAPPSSCTTQQKHLWPWPWRWLGNPQNLATEVRENGNILGKPEENHGTYENKAV